MRKLRTRKRDEWMKGTWKEERKNTGNVAAASSGRPGPRDAWDKACRSFTRPQAAAGEERRDFLCAERERGERQAAMETQRERELGIGIGFGMPFSLLQLLIAWQWHAVLKLVVLAPTSVLHMHASPVFFFLWPGLACSAVCPAVAVAAPAPPRPDPIHRHYSILLLSRACCITIAIFSNHHIPSWADPTSCPSY